MGVDPRKLRPVVGDVVKRQGPDRRTVPNDDRAGSSQLRCSKIDVAIIQVGISSETPATKIQSAFFGYVKLG